MKLLLLIAWLGNLIDTIATVYLTSLGYVEANPIMAQLLNCPVIFVIVKIALMTGLCAYLWLKRLDKHAMPMAIVASVVYGLITAYYGWFLKSR